MTNATSFHKLYTPEARGTMRRRHAGSGAVNVTLAGGSETQYPSLDIVDSLSYYYDNSLNTEIPAGSSEASRIIGWESRSTWRLLIELFRMEALADRLREQVDEREDNRLNEGFLKYPNFRRLMAVLRWIHWVNAEKARSCNKNEAVRPSKTAYPTSTNNGAELPIDTAIQRPDKIYAGDLSREQQLCKALWTLLTQGKVLEAVDLCVSTGHRWRGGVLHAAAGHEFMAEDSQDEVVPDWVESCIMAPLLGLESICGGGRLEVKKTARDILKSDKRLHGIDEMDAALTAYLCGEEAVMKMAMDSGSDSNIGLWISLHCLKEEFAAFLTGEEEHEGREEEMTDAILHEKLEGIVIGLESDNRYHQLKKLQSDLILQDYSAVMQSLHDWVEDGICVIEGKEVDVDLSSPAADLSAVFLLRSLAASLATVLRDLIARNMLFDAQEVSSVIVGNIECMVFQLKEGEGSELTESNNLIVESLSLLTDEDVKLNTWAWYLRQHMGCEWTAESSALFPPVISLLETFAPSAIAVVKLLIQNCIERKSETILTHAFGTALEAGAEIRFALGCANSLWLIAQSAAKSTGSGIYMEMCETTQYQCEDPDEAVASLVSSIGDMMGEALVVLVLADLHSARSSLSLFQTASFTHSGHKLMSIHAALESLNEEKQSWQDIFGTVSSAVQVLDRVSAVMDRNSLLEQQKAYLAQLSSKNTARLNPSASTETRRQIMDAQRLIDSSSDLVSKLVDEIGLAVQELLKSPESPINPDLSFLGIEPNTWKNLVASFFDVVLESCVQAIALLDDRKRHETLIKSVKSSKWIEGLLGRSRINQILEEIN